MWIFSSKVSRQANQETELCTFPSAIPAHDNSIHCSCLFVFQSQQVYAMLQGFGEDSLAHLEASNHVWKIGPYLQRALHIDAISGLIHPRTPYNLLVPGTESQNLGDPDQNQDERFGEGLNFALNERP